MDAKTIAVSVVSITIACLLAVTLLIPIISESTTTEDTFTNTGNGQYRYISSDETYTLNWYYATPTKVTINGTELNAITGNEVLAMGDFTLRIYGNPTGYAQLILADNVSGVTANVSDSKDFTFSYEDGTITASNGTVTKTIDTDGFYGLVPENGTHTMKVGTSTVYLKGDETLLVMGITNVGSQWNTGYLIDGTIKEYTVEQWTGTNSYVPTDITDDSAEVSGYEDLYTVKQFTWDVDNSGTTQHVTYNTFLVPLSVTAERSIHPDASTIALLNIIPLFVVVGIILGTVGFIALRK